MDMTVNEIVEKIAPPDEDWKKKARERTARLVMPTRALGRLHDIGEAVCAIQRTLSPSVEKKAVLIMAGDHGVVDEGVSAYPQVITGEMVKAFLHGGAGINVIARHVGVEVHVVDMGIIPELDVSETADAGRLWVHKVAPGTANFTRGPAMTRQQAEQAVLTGFKLASGLFEKGFQILGTGDMGIGNTTPSAAVGAVITGEDLDGMVGRGTGVDDAGLDRKKDVIRRGIEKNSPDAADGIDVLSKVGGFEIGGIAGCILAAACHGRPVVIDGFISTAGALIAHTLCPQTVHYMFSGHCSEENGHRVMLNHLGLSPLLDLGMRLGEGTGGALAMGIIEAAVKVITGVLTFEEAGVTNK